MLGLEPKIYYGRLIYFDLKQFIEPPIVGIVWCDADKNGQEHLQKQKIWRSDIFVV